MRTKPQPYRVRLLVALLLFLPLPVTFSQQIPKAEKHFQVGMELEKAHKYHEAAEEFSQAIQINPEFSEAYYHLGFNALQDGNSEEAIRALMQLTQLEPNNNKARMALGQIYYGLGFLNDALALYFRAAQQSPTDPEIYFYIGMISFDQKAYAQAAQALQRTISLDPRMIKVRELLASVYEAQGDLPNAYRQLREAAEIAPQSPGPPSDLGLAVPEGGQAGGGVTAIPPGPFPAKGLRARAHGVGEDLPAYGPPAGVACATLLRVAGNAAGSRGASGTRHGGKHARQEG